MNAKINSFSHAATFAALLVTTNLGREVRAQNLPSGVERVTSVEGITEFHLTNGLSVLLFSDPSKPVMTVNITYKVGSRHEGYGEKGMAHLLEHLLFKGTPGHLNIPQEMTKHGAFANGTTWFDRTCYFETFEAKEENLRWALELEADRMLHSFIAKKDLNSEFSVVRNEYEMGENDPENVLFKRMLPAVFQWHNYGHDTIGEKSDIERAPIERLQAFYRAYYQPDNAVLIVAGKIDQPKTLDLITEYFAALPKAACQLIPTYTKEPTQDGERMVTLRRIGDVQVLACMYHGAPGSHPDSAALAVLQNLLTDTPSGRLYKALVESKKCVSVAGDAWGWAEAGLISIKAQLRLDQSLDEAKTTMLAVLDNLRNDPPSAEEVAKAIARLLKTFELALKDSTQFCIRLSDDIGAGDWRLAFVFRDNLEKVTAGEVAAVAAHYFKQSNRTIGLFIPEKTVDRAETPDAVDLAVLLKDYQGKASLAPGEDFDTSPASIEKRAIRGELANGMRYTLVPKKTRGNSVAASLTVHYGSLETLKAKGKVPDFVVDLLNKGTRNRTRQQINDTFDSLKARVEVSSGFEVAQATVFMETDREHLAAVVRVVAEILRQPSFPAAEFGKLQQEYLASLEQRKTDPNEVAFNLLQRVSNPSFLKNDPRYTRTFEEESEAIRSVTIDEVKEFYYKFYGGTRATVSVVGDFDPKEVSVVLSDTLGDWNNPTPYERIRTDYEPVQARSEILRIPDKANAVFVAQSGYAMQQDDPEYPALVIGGEMIGGGWLHSRLATRIRQKDGLSYGVGGGFDASPMDKKGVFWAYMMYNPDNVTRLEAAFQEETQRAAKDGFTPEELEQAKAAWIESRKVERSFDRSLANKLSSYLYYGRDLNWDAGLEDQVQHLTVAQVNASVNKHLDFSRMITVKAGDFKQLMKPAPSE